MTTQRPMQLGMIGLGRMGANLVRRLMRDGHRCVAYDVSSDAVKALEADGAAGASTLKEFVDKLEAPRAVWLMLPAAIVQQTLDELSGLLEAGDIVIDGGNSYYRDDIARAKALASSGLHYVDCGTSGGVWGLERGYCLMIGGEEDIVTHLDPLFKTIAPGKGQAEPTPGRTRTDGTAPDGYLRCGPNGAGHFVKMVHNGIEYGMMAAIAEGLSIIKNADAGLKPQEVRRRDDAASRPVGLPVRDRRRRGGRGLAPGLGRSAPGSSTSSPTPSPAPRSWRSSPAGCRTRARVVGRCIAAVDEGVPAPVITASLIERFESRGLGLFTDKILSAMRSEFGGHAEKPS